VPRLSDIRAQDRAVASLRRALTGGRVPHAYLFCGPAGAGKYTAGLALASAVNCLLAPGEGCDSCDSCARIGQGSHPDVQTLQREGAARIIPIEAIRSQILARVGMAPHEARARFYLIEEAGALMGPAANALLKTLEEPPARTHFVLATTAPDKLLPTIRSRCQRVSFAALPPHLRAAGADAADSEDEGARLTELVDDMLAAVDSDSAAALHEAAAASSQAKEQVADLLRLLAIRLHEASRQAALADDLDTARIVARRAHHVLDTEVAVTLHNAHPQLAFDHLLRRLRAEGPVLSPRQP
jgi:DNA polymerase III subunit delta'